MHKPTDEREKRLAQLKREVTRRGFDRHASVLKDILELPAELQSPAVLVLATNETIQTIINFPPQIQHGWIYVPRQALLFTSNGVIHLLASIWPDQPPQVAYLKGCGLMYLKVTLILLYGFLEIVAQGYDVPTGLGVEFNTVAWSHLSLPLRQLLQLANAASGHRANTTRPSLPPQYALEELPLKFSNGVKIYGLLPGEQLEELVFQPGVWKQWLYFFRRPITANTLLLLTSNYVVLIQEDVKVSQGWILTYIPRDCITEMQNQPCDLYNELIVRLKRENQETEYKILLKGEAVEAWHLRWIQHGGQWKELPAQMGMN